MLSEVEINRYSRHVIMPEIGIEGQQKLKQAKILVVGAGGLGCPVLQYLAAAGVGTIGVVDNDIVDETNLQRQILFSQEDIGNKKAQVAARQLKIQNPCVTIIPHGLRLASSNALETIKDYDLVIDGSDNFPTRYLVNDACLILNKSFVFGSIFKFEGQVSVFNYKKGPTYRCLFPEPPVEAPNCSEIGVLGVLPGIIGTIMANEVLKVILGIGEVLSGRLFVMNALTLQTQIISFEKSIQNSPINSLIDYNEFCKEKLLMGNDISISELQNLIENKRDFQLIDVREPFEYASYNIKGANIPLASLEKNIESISRTKKVIIHCKSGARSRKAIEFLQQKYGFTNLCNLAGGIDAMNTTR